MYVTIKLKTLINVVLATVLVVGVLVVTVMAQGPSSPRTAPAPGTRTGVRAR